MNLLMRDQEKYEQGLALGMERGIEKGCELERANTLKEAQLADRTQIFRKPD